ncbi:hypothetical protein Tco_0919362 [Tanacetum coccineum]
MFPMNLKSIKGKFEEIWCEVASNFKLQRKLKLMMKVLNQSEEKIVETRCISQLKKTGKRRKQIARKGFHTDHNKDGSEDLDEVNEKDDSTSSTKIPINPVPVATKITPSADVYMLIERKYPLSAEVCKAMLDKKLQGGKPDEDCYKLLKMMEKQAGVGVETEGATTTTSGLDAGMDSGNIHESPLRSHEAPLPEGNTSGSAEDSLNLKELMDIVPKLVLRIDNLEKELQQTKSTYGKAVLTLVERVKLLEAALKRKSMKVILSESEDEETEDQGRKIQDIDDDPLVSLVRNSMEEKEADFVTPKKVSASGEAQEEDISPTTLEAAKTLSKVASQNVSTYKRRARSASKGKDIGIGMDFFSAAKERLNSAEVEVNTEVNPGSAGVNTGNTPVSTPSVIQTVNVIVPSPVKSQREGKAPMTSEDVQATQKTKEQIRQEEAGLAEAMRLQALQDEEDARQVHLDALLAKRIQEEQELSEQQQKRKAEVQEAAQFYTEEDWDTIRAKLEANAELRKSLQGENMSSDDFAKRMVDMINQKKKYYAEQKAKAKRDKPMTQAQQRDYMSTFIKNQSSWKMAQLKKLTFEELKVEFEKLMRSIESFVPMGSEERVKRAGTHAYKTAKHEAEEDMEALVKGNDTNSSSGTDIPVSVVLVAIKPPSIANWKIIKLGNKGVYQIIREDRTYITYINFGAMLKSISRDNLTELYRLVMQKYGTNGPEDEYERVFWGDLKTMFDPPLSTDPVWNLPYQQKVLRWRYYDTCRVHCLTLESADIYMLT